MDLGSNITGVSGIVEVTPTLDLALALHPQTRQVVVAGGNALLDRDLLALAQKEFKAYEGKVSFSYLPDLTPEEMRQRLAVLPDKTIVIFLSFSDNAGKAPVSPEGFHFVRPRRLPLWINQASLGHGMSAAGC